MDLAALVDSGTQALTVPRPLLELVAAADGSLAPPDVVAIVAAEPRFAGQVVRLANSPFFRLPRRLDSLDDAATSLGARPLRSLAVAVGALDVFLSSPTYGGRAWGHALNAATLARSLAVYLGDIDPDAAFVAGMFHDVGKVVMSEALDGYPLVTARHVAPDGSDEGGPPPELAFVHAERALYGYEHQEVSASLLEAWHVPDDVVAAVRAHHLPPDTDALACVVNVADGLADEAGTSDGYTLAAVDGPVAASLRLPPEVLEEIGRTASIVDADAPRPATTPPLADDASGDPFPLSPAATAKRRWFSRQE